MERDLLYAYQGLKDTTKDAEPFEDHLPASIHQGASNLHSDEDVEDKIKLLDPTVKKLIRTYLEVFGELPPPASCDKLVQMDLKLKPEFVGHKIRRRPYPAPKQQANEIKRQIQECINACLVLEYKDGDYPQHCSPCFLSVVDSEKRVLQGFGANYRVFGAPITKKPYFLPKANMYGLSYTKTAIRNWVVNVIFLGYAQF